MARYDSYEPEEPSVDGMLENSFKKTEKVVELMTSSGKRISKLPNEAKWSVLGGFCFAFGAVLLGVTGFPLAMATGFGLAVGSVGYTLVTRDKEKDALDRAAAMLERGIEETKDDYGSTSSSAKNEHLKVLRDARAALYCDYSQKIRRSLAAAPERSKASLALPAPPAKNLVLSLPPGTRRLRVPGGLAVQAGKKSGGD